MKSTLLKRFFTMLLVLVIGISTTNSVFAADVSLGDFNQTTVTPTASGNKPVYGTISPNESKTFTVHLNSYIGLSKDFMISASSDATAGMLIVHLYSPRGTMVSNDWLMGINQVAKWTIPLPSSGDWTLEIASNCPDGPVDIVAKWAD